MNSSSEKRKSTNTKSVDKTLAILSTFSETTPQQRTTDIAAKLGLSVSTVSRHLNTMLDWGILERDDETGYYFPGLQIVTLAGAALQNSETYRHSSPEIQEISLKYGVHGHVGIPRGTQLVHLISSSCEDTLNLRIPMGHCHPLYCCAMGRAVMAFMPPADVQRILNESNLRKITIETKTDPEEIMRELAKVRKTGYCVVVNELSEGKASIAAPIFDRNRNPIAAISVSTSERSLEQPERAKELTKAVMRASRKISGKLGYFPS